MKTRNLTGNLAKSLAAMRVGMNSPIRADDTDAAKPDGLLGSLWALPKEE